MNINLKEPSESEEVITKVCKLSSPLSFFKEKGELKTRRADKRTNHYHINLSCRHLSDNKAEK